MVTHGSLFSGIGGFDLGLERHGIETMWQCELDPKATAVLEHHWPDTTRYSDVTDMHGGQVEPVDVITFGSPCQDLSVAGQRAGLDGTRSGLVYEALRIASEMKEATGGAHPQLLVWENVPGALSSNAGRDFAAVLDALADVGAVDIGWRVLDAQWFGLAQRRRRVFVVADLGGRRAGQILALAESGSGGAAPRREAGPPVAALTANGVGAGGGPDNNAAQAGHLIAEPQSFAWQVAGTERTWIHDEPGRTRTLTSQPLAVVHALQDPITSDDITPPLDTDGTSLAVAANQRGEVRTADVHPSLSASRSAKQFAGILEPNLRVRRLTPTECERLQGFPDGWTEPAGADTHRYRTLGNAVCVPVAAWAGHNIVATLEAAG